MTGNEQFERTTLPPAILAEMFKESLVVTNELQQAAGSANKPIAIPGPLPKQQVVAIPETPMAAPPGEEALASEGACRDDQIGSPMAAPPGEEALAWLGDFRERVLLVVTDFEARFVSDDQLQLLTKMLAAVGLSLADAAIVNLAHHPVRLDVLFEKLPAEVAIFFGTEPVELGLPMRFPQFQVQRWNHCTYLYVPPLQQLLGNDEATRVLKTNLWVALKKIFIER
jgi:hypothetical protein